MNFGLPAPHFGGTSIDGSNPELQCVCTGLQADTHFEGEKYDAARLLLKGVRACSPVQAKRSSR